ncbi:xylulokinase [Thermoactinomyces vulgaris]|jgi:xylulokinase|uniref:Xylulose kinase n=1 Tax=Thermoactinomyces vulgaris TaxID=2026 RepID=A0ABS0QFE5_THEVU|nr:MULTISPECIES: xylulokinase [Thermoactinomyces]MBA4551205.1 xylulokinase [Thermoactinomyces vulgaris]MBA4596836.1 xylulokinase [Thermoactinomyces vulgaris]MBH8583749.1 xylulokinase [Thermoactinomyces sp. CICC 10735]MBH8587978.1 xylulokinase [Thermoactinomyces vulgaris]MCF6135754.1 xylulokinase [Thermoactinomyces vulgaris]
MKYVIGVDLGTSAVKLLLVNKPGEVVLQVSKSYPLIQERSGWSEQNPDDWVKATISGLKELLHQFAGDPEDIEGISFSGQMHGLVLLDENLEVLRNAILWNDTRTTEECREIEERVGKERLLEITKNPALEGFTLPKLLWVKKHEPHLYQKAGAFVLPKDYVRFKLTGKLHMDYSDAAGTLLMNVPEKTWSREIGERVGVDMRLCPPLIDSVDEVGTVTPEITKETGLSPATRVFAGGADNACGAIGAGILKEGKTLVSIGTSGVVLTYEKDGTKDFGGKVHYFNHGAPDAFYTMGVTLAAGYSLSWLKEVLANDGDFDELLNGIDRIPAGADGLLFTPYIAGERTPHADALIRGSWIGLDSSHQKEHLVRSVLEGITFSLNESVEMFRANGKKVDQVISIGGGAKNETWLQMQADIFGAKVVKLKSEQGPGMGAAMLAAAGCGWFESLSECAEQFVKEERVYEPIPENVKKYRQLFRIYREIYPATSGLSRQLQAFRHGG